MQKFFQKNTRSRIGNRVYRAIQFVLRDGKIVLVIGIVKQLWNNEALACDSNGKLGLVGKTGLLKNLGNVPFNGSDCDVKDMMGMSAYNYAVLFKKTRIVDILKPFHKE